LYEKEDAERRDTMLKLAIIADRPRAPPERRVSAILARIREHRGEEIDEEQRSLDAMSHWRDPIERLRTHHRQRRTLVDDNPASG
jgi:hypothetical protein